MSDDTSRLLALLVTREGHVPTGSPLSMSIAYWGYSPTFDAICNLARRVGLRPSVYVDDMTFTSPDPIPRVFQRQVNHMLERVGLFLNDAKTRRHTKRHFKVVTGAAISPRADLRVPNRIRLNILTTIHNNGNIEAWDLRALRSMQGRLTSARRIEPTFLEPTHRRVEKALASHKKARARNIANTQ
jgi:hypothetical protein